MVNVFGNTPRMDWSYYKRYYSIALKLLTTVFDKLYLYS